MEVSASGYYDWLKRPQSDRSKQNQALLEKIKQIHRASRAIYGYPRVYQALAAQGESCGKHRVARLMRQSGIRSKVAKRYRRSYESKHREGIHANRLQRQFNADKPNQKWVSDISLIPTQSGWVYLAVVMDLYSRAVIGWSMNCQMKSDLVKGALQMALDNREINKKLLLHSDQGSQYRSADYQQLLSDNGITCSMSRKGNCWDNAVVESFFQSLKTEWVYHYRYQNQTQAMQSIFEYIEVFYNRQRLHSTINYLAPLEYEKTAR
jgi:transposase InsO family protein